MIGLFPFRLSMLFVVLFIFTSTLSSENKLTKASPEIHELTLYLMPTLYPLDWESPSSLYKSMRLCYIKSITKRDNYLLGHLAVGLNSSLLPKPLLIAQSSGSLREKLDLIFNKKVGYAIIGAPLKGRIETDKELRHKLKIYAKRDKLAFIRYKISKKAAQRILDFIELYSSKLNDQHAPSDFYGGAFWPRFHHEGAGCSAFGMALLDLVNVMEPTETDAWELRLKIPMNLIGGEYNNDRKVHYSTIRKANQWYEGNGQMNKDYVVYSVFEPSIMFDWVMDKRLKPEEVFRPIEENGVPGVVVDMTQVQFDENEPLFIQRTVPNLFINYYFKKILPTISHNESRAETMSIPSKIH